MDVHTRGPPRPPAVLPARGDAIALWDDGLVMATVRGDGGLVMATVRGDGGAVRRHRALPVAAPWLAAQRGSGVLRTLGARMLAVVAPQRIAA
ncbi:hypothetical protein [Streptomyces sp. NPDC050564]|uniref:hypothetical protein n=1 Tax=Streptomyces sp. NPDC050564 TaxID=3365631 RepID=UPI0037A0CDEF